jgi:hypothetical protein
MRQTTRILSIFCVTTLAGIALHAQEALMKLYREAKDDNVHSAILAIPRRVYHEHTDVGDHGRSCHGDEAYVHFDLDAHRQ